MNEPRRAIEGGTPGLPDRELFAEWLQDALNNLYDSIYLQNHPLIELLTDENVEPVHGGQSLRRVLLQTIRNLRPHPGVPAQSPDWRAYRILELRYIEGLSPQDVMEQIGVSRSHYFREQARVLDALVTVKWTQIQAKVEMNAPAAAPGQGTRKDLALAEVERLRVQAVWQQVDVGALVEQLQSIIVPLAHAKAVQLEWTTTDFSIPRADRSMLRQAILNAVSYGIDMACGSELIIDPYEDENVRGICIRSRTPTGQLQSGKAGSVAPRQGIGLEVCAQLMQANGGQLVLRQSGNECWEARLLWQNAQPPILLVVDDNESFIALFRRYLSGFEWRVVGASSGREAQQILEEILPTVIVLDVMMPEEDGWELLRRWRTEARTATIPVIICSVLNEPHLALALGASAYLPKPVTQQALLQALSAWY